MKHLSEDRGLYPRGHGAPEEALRASITGKPLKRVKAKHIPTVHVEPTILDGDFANPRKNKWKRARNFRDTKGIPFKGPLTFSAVKAVCNISFLLNSLHHLTGMYVNSIAEYRDSVSIFHDTRRLVERALGGNTSEVAGAALSQCAINLRSSKFRLTSGRART